MVHLPPEVALALSGESGGDAQRGLVEIIAVVLLVGAGGAVVAAARRRRR